MENLGTGVSVRRLSDELVLRLELVYNFKAGSRKHGFVLYWVMSESKDNSIIKNLWFFLFAFLRFFSQKIGETGLN